MASSNSAKAPPRVMKLNEAVFSPRFEYGDQAQVAPLCGAEDGTLLGTGLVRLTQASIPWTIKYDEFVLVLEGTFTVKTVHGTLVANTMDAIWLPQGTTLTYQSDNALLLYAIQPTDWAKKQEA